MSETSKDPGRAEVVVVGAGPSGAVVAKKLVESGIDVLCLEQGDWPDYTTSRAADERLELSAGKRWSSLPNVRAGVGDYPLNESESAVSPLMWNGVGGSSLLYAAHWMRSLPSDFRVRSTDGVGDDWPIDYDDLVPYYEEVERDFGVAGLPGDPAYPRLDSFPMEPTPIGVAGRRVGSAHNELGWHWWPSSNAIATRPYRRLNACVQRAACMSTCADRAKASVDITHWPDILAAGGRLLPRATVSRIETDARGRASGVVYFDADGVERRVQAEVVVLAANGIGTPRILLASATDEHPDGLANSSGLVGRRLMMHPFGAVVGVFDEDIGSYQGVWGQLIYSLQFYETDESRGFVRGAKWNLMPTGGPLTMTRPFPWGYDTIWGEGFHRQVANRLGHSAVWGVIAEDLPEEHNRVVLDPELTDAYGNAAPRLIYKTSDNTDKLLAFHLARACESLEAAGAKETIVAPQIRETGWHLLGTTKMGDDPATSVVDPGGRAHDVPNLFVADGSTWPTSSGTNPTATIAAMALRCADGIVRTRNQMKVA